MYDSIDFKLSNRDANSIDFLAETPCYFDVKGEHTYNDEFVITGDLNGFKISVTKNNVNITNGSLCKWYLGDNFQTMKRDDTQKAIENLSDILHLPINKATVSRIDIAQNFIMKYPTSVYFNHLGNNAHSTRLEQPNGLYYTNANGSLVFYDKVKEQKAKGQLIPELYQNTNTLRYEARFKKRLRDTFKVERVTGGMLYDEDFYKDIINKWGNLYNAIQKINDISINFVIMKGKKDFDLMGRLCFIEQNGGQLAMLRQINEAQKKGELNRRQADELKATIKASCKLKENRIIQSDVIQELNKKVNEACQFYM